MFENPEFFRPPPKLLADPDKLSSKSFIEEQVEGIKYWTVRSLERVNKNRDKADKLAEGKRKTTWRERQVEEKYQDLRWASGNK